MDLPENEKPGVPSYMVSFGDMITLLLTFFILLVALADTQEAGLVGQGRGPLIKHINAKGQPGVMPGRLYEDRQGHKRDKWWIPSQEGDPDELELVKEKLFSEFTTKFRPGEGAIRYEKDRLVMKMPARIEYEDGRPTLTKVVEDVLARVAEIVRRKPERRVRINGDVPGGNPLEVELYDSANQGHLIYHRLGWLGVRPNQMSLWGWGSSRSLLPGDKGNPQNRGIILEIIDPPAAAEPGDTSNG